MNNQFFDDYFESDFGIKPERAQALPAAASGLLKLLASPNTQATQPQAAPVQQQDRQSGGALPDKMGFWEMINRQKFPNAFKRQDAIAAREEALLQQQQAAKRWEGYQTDNPYMRQAVKIAAQGGNTELARAMLKEGHKQSIAPGTAAVRNYIYGQQNPGFISRENELKQMGSPKINTNTNVYGKQLESIDDRVELDDRLYAAKNDREYVGRVIEGGDLTDDSLNRVNRTLQLMDNPDVYTGIFADQVLDAKKLGNALGGEFEGVADTEALRQKMGDFVMARVDQTKGSVSTKEMDLFKEYSANMANTPAANKEILRYTADKLKRDKKLSSLAFQLRDAGLKNTEVRKRLRQFKKDNPLAIETEAERWRGGVNDNSTGDAGPSAQEMLNDKGFMEWRKARGYR